MAAERRIVVLCNFKPPAVHGCQRFQLRPRQRGVQIAHLEIKRPSVEGAFVAVSEASDGFCQPFMARDAGAPLAGGQEFRGVERKDCYIARRSYAFAVGIISANRLRAVLDHRLAECSDAFYICGETEHVWNNYKPGAAVYKRLDCIRSYAYSCYTGIGAERFATGQGHGRVKAGAGVRRDGDSIAPVQSECCQRQENSGGAGGNRHDFGAVEHDGKIVFETGHFFTLGEVSCLKGANDRGDRRFADQRTGMWDDGWWTRFHVELNRNHSF